MIPEIPSAPLNPSLTDDRKPKTIASKMEAMFMEVLVKSMEETVEADGGLFGNSSSSEIYRGMFREQLAASLSQSLHTPLEKQLEHGLERGEESGGNPIPPAPIALPVDGRITSPVGWRRDPLNGEMRFHKGTDIAAAAGTAVRAVEGGVVLESETKVGYGNAVVILSDSGKRMLYGHNRENLVRAGDRVESGATIAQVGSTGRSTGPHVHFEIME